MDQDYGREEWQEDENAARTEALRRIGVARETAAEVLDLSDLTALTALPGEIAGLTAMRRLFAGDRRADGNATPFFGRRLRDVSVLSVMTGLTSLDLRGTRVSDIAVLSGLAGLTSLGLRRTPVSDIAALSGLAGLISLDLSGTRVSDIAPLSGLVGLTSLGLSGTRVWNIAALSELAGLTSLDLSGTQVVNIAAVSGLAGLTSLYLSRTQVSHTAALSGLAGLTSLDLSGTRVSDLRVLLLIPPFAGGRARYLQFQKTPVADPHHDRRLHKLSLLDPQPCAVETVQYLKGTHPDFQGGAGRRPLAERLAASSPVGVVVEDGRLGVTNPGTPERVRPRELAQRVVALRVHVAALQDMAQGRQVPPWFARQVAGYAAGLVADEPTFILLDGPMAFLRGGAGDRYVTEALDGALVGGWRHLVVLHDDLRPHLMPPEEDDDLPPLTPEATPEAGIALADEAIAAAREAEGPGGTDKAVAEALVAMKDYFEVAKSDATRRPGLLRRGFKAFGGTLALMATGTAGLTYAGWLATPQGQSFLAAIKPILEAILKFYPG